MNFNNPLAPKTNRLQAKSAEIKGWVREVMGLPDGTPITIAELACRDEGCPDVETVIGVLEPGIPIKTVRVHASMKDVQRSDVADAAITANQ
ncbi:MAG: nitrate reductase [Pseudomonadota bacterium]